MSVKCSYPLKPHSYYKKKKKKKKKKKELGFAGVNIFFSFLIQNIDCGYSLEPINVLSKIIKNIKIFPMKFSIFASKKISLYCMGMFSYAYVYFCACELD